MTLDDRPYVVQGAEAPEPAHEREIEAAQVEHEAHVREVMGWDDEEDDE